MNSTEVLPMSGTKEILKPWTFDDHMREYDRLELQSIVDDGASSTEPNYTDTEEIYQQYEGELWAILNEEAEERSEPVLNILVREDLLETITDGDNFRQFIVWHCMERVAVQILSEPEEEEEAE